MRALTMCNPIFASWRSFVSAPYLRQLANRQFSINASIPFSRDLLRQNSCSRDSCHYDLLSSSHAVETTGRGSHPAFWTLHRQFSLSAVREQSETLALTRAIRSRLWLMWDKVKNGLKFIKYSRKNLKQAGLVMYSCCTDPLNHLHFFDVLGLPDTFNSWFKVTELHVWMCAARLSLEAYDGKYVRNEIVRNMWKDVDSRSQRLGEAAMLLRKKQIRELSDQFRANLFAYDEGLMCDDKVLAGAIWRNFFAMNCDDPRKVELLVHYVRKQIDNLDSQDRYNILGRGIVKWIPINEVKDADQRTGLKG